MPVILKKLDIQASNIGSYAGNTPVEKGSTCIDSINPANNSLIAQVSTANSHGYEQILKMAEQSQQQLAHIPAPKRAEIVREMAILLREKKDYLGTLISLETGKIKAEGDGEVQEMIDMADFAVGQARMLYGKVMPSERPQHRLYEQWMPLGVCGVITAFNFPAAVWAWNAFLAVICGNSVVWKPSPQAPLTAVAIHKMCQIVMEKLGVDGAFSILMTDEPDMIHRLVMDTRIQLISFTGSTAIGRQVGERVASRFGKCLLELGGNNACIIDKSATLDLAIHAVVFSAVGTAGQRCTSLRRLMVHADIADEVITRLQTMYRTLIIGNPLEKETHVGPIISVKAIEKYRVLMTSIQADERCDVLYGGEVLDVPGNYVEPTLVRVEPDFELLNDEHFYPILFIMTYTDIDDAIRWNNQVKHGLSSAIFSQDISVVEQFLSATGSDCGIANVNMGTSGAEIGGAFGGEKHTGGGREAGSDSWKSYMRRQTVGVNWGHTLPLAQGIDFSVS